MRDEQNLRVMNTVMKNFISKSHLGLNILIKLNEMLIKAFVVFSRLRGQFDASFYEITFSRRPFREEKVSPFLSKNHSYNYVPTSCINLKGGST